MAINPRYLGYYNSRHFLCPNNSSFSQCFIYRSTGDPACRAKHASQPDHLLHVILSY